MRFERTDSFARDYADLEEVDRRRIDTALRKLSAFPLLPGLRLGLLEGFDSIFYFRASDSLRVTCNLEPPDPTRVATVILRRAGHHDILRTP